MLVEPLSFISVGIIFVFFHWVTSKLPPPKQSAPCDIRVKRNKLVNHHAHIQVASAYGMKDNDPLKPEYTPYGIAFRLTKKFTFEPNDELPYPVVEQSLDQPNDTGTRIRVVCKHVPQIISVEIYIPK